MHTTFTGDNKPTDLSISEISSALKRTVEKNFSFVRVRGEVSGFKRAASGHLYMDLKDENAVINTVCWKGVANGLGFEPMDGMEVIVSGKITTYAPRSNYQLQVSSMEIAGEGALLKILEDRKKILAAEGLFNAEQKKPLPRLPKRIGVVTSPTGAVIRDIIHRISDRFPTPIYIYPCRVQGQGSASEIEAGIDFFNVPKTGIEPVDIIIVARGGGSVEDLWAFNEECVARAVHRSKIPVISAVGHETDTTLIDYVSDRRAPTPTAAAEMAVPVLADVKNYVDNKQMSMNTILQNKIQTYSLRLQTLDKSLPDVDSILSLKMQRFDELSFRLINGLKNNVIGKENQFDVVSSRLVRPHTYIAMLNGQLSPLELRLNTAIDRIINRHENILHNMSGLLESYSFKKTLQRGFALVRDTQGSVVKNVQSAKESGQVLITLIDGDIDANVKK